MRDRARDGHHHAARRRPGRHQGAAAADHGQVPRLGRFHAHYRDRFDRVRLSDVVSGKFTEHFLPEHFQRVSLSFLVDTMDKRRGGCAPNIAYTLALLGERPMLMATAGQDFNDYRRWLDAAGIDTSLVTEVADKFTASFFCSTDQANNQIASFYTGAMAHAAELSFPDGGEGRPCDHFAERSGGDDASTSKSAARWASRSSSIRASSARA
jgi:sugar/nucleoside kinase (ribokinase family)